VVVARHARDKDDLADLLGALGLPCGADDLVTLLPHLTTADTPTTGVPMPVNAFTATAVSMLNNSDSPEHVRSTTEIRTCMDGDTRAARIRVLSTIAVVKFTRLRRAVDCILTALTLLALAALSALL
jgi:phosphatidylserine synthase